MNTPSQPIEVPVKIAAEVERKGTWVSRFKAATPYIFAAYLTKGLINFIEAFKAGWNQQVNFLAKLWFLLTTFLGAFAERIWLSDVMVLDNLNKLTSNAVKGVVALYTRVELLIGLVLIYYALFRLRLPVIGDISLLSIVCSFINYERSRAGLPFKIFLIVFIAPWLYILASSKGIADYYPFKGVYLFIKTLISNPKAIL